MCGLPRRDTGETGEWPLAMRELYRRQTETTQRLASAVERVADALEGPIQTIQSGDRRVAGERAALRVVK